jgi:hypothetical protein
MVNHSVQPSTFIMIELYVELKAHWNTPNEDFASGSQGHETPNAYVEPISSTIPNASFGTNRNQSVPEEKIILRIYNLILEWMTLIRRNGKSRYNFNWQHVW